MTDKRPVLGGKCGDHDDNAVDDGDDHDHDVSLSPFN